MSFSDALNYPFKGANIPKVLTIILVFLLIVAVVVVGGIMMEAAGIILLAIPIMIAYAVFIGGYSIEVIRSVASGEDVMPQAQVGRDIGRGIVVVIANIVHMIPLFILIGIAFMMIGSSLTDSIIIDAYGNIDTTAFSNALEDSIGTICGMGLVMVVVGFLLSYTLTVGMVRYAVEDSIGALFSIPANFGKVLSNMGAVFGLFIRSLGIGIIYYILMNVVNWIFNGMVSDAFSPYGEPGIGAMIIVTVYGILYLSLNLMNQLSNTHLIAGFGQAVGISSRKSKHDDYEF